MVHLAALAKPVGWSLLVAGLVGAGWLRAHPHAHVHAEPGLPAWFGAPDLPDRAIGGQLVEEDGTPVGGTVHLRLDAPDATVWRGLDVTTGADGRFDFGALRAGRYTVLAVTPGEASRTVVVDTRAAAADALAVELAPCTTVARTVTDASGAAVAGARLDIAGVHVATTDEGGHYSVCFLAASTPPTVRALGYAAENLAVGADGRLLRDVALVPAVTLHGHVTGADGSPAAGLLVQPMNIDSFGRWAALPVHAITDAAGAFQVTGVAKRQHVIPDRDWCPTGPARYGFRVFAGAVEHADEASITDVARAMDAGVELSVR